MKTHLATLSPVYVPPEAPLRKHGAARLTEGTAYAVLRAPGGVTPAHDAYADVPGEYVLGQCPEWDLGCYCAACNLPAGLSTSCPRCCLPGEVGAAIRGMHAVRALVAMVQGAPLLAHLAACYPGGGL